MTTSSRLLLTALLLAAPWARAQYVVTPSAGATYPALTTPTPIALSAPASLDPVDRGRATLPLGFTFPFYGRTYTAVTVTANGVLFLEPSSAAHSDADFGTNVAIPSGAEPNGVIAPLWDDLRGDNATSALQRQALSGSNGQGVALEWKDWNRSFGSYSLTFQARLWENGIIEFFYGPLTGAAATAISATVGIEAPTGAVGTQGLTACAATPSCQISSFDPQGTGTPINYLRFGPPAGVDLQALGLRIDAITPDGGALDIAATVTSRNFGTAPSGDFGWGLYLSEDTIFDPLVDLPLSGVPFGPLSHAPLSQGTTSGAGTVARPDGGSWYVLAALDPAGAIAETNELNNAIASSVPYAAGVDLVAESIAPPPIAGPGDPVSIPVTFSNQGFEVAGAVQVSLWASVDAQLTTDDRLLTQETVAIAGGQQVQRPLTFTLPLGFPADDYYVLLQLDDGPAGGAIPERSDANNLVSSATRMQVRQADLVVTQVRVLRAQPPYDEVDEAFFGEAIRVEAFVANLGGATASNTRVSVFLSDNESLNAGGDPFVGEVTGQSFSAGASRWVTVGSGVMPSTSVAGQPLPVQPYFFFAAALATGQLDSNPSNNFTRSKPVIGRAPAPDLAVLELRVPQRVGAGDVVAVSRAFANLGNRPAAATTYRYVLSANTIISLDDEPVALVTATGEVPAGELPALAVGQQASGVDLVRIPPNAVGANAFLGVIVDPDDVVAEADEGDNGLAGTLSEVVAQALRLATPVLPDGVVGQPYLVRLEGQGAPGPYRFSLRLGAALPAGLTLSDGGVLSGVPTQPGVALPVIRLEAPGAAVDTAVSLRVATPTASLAITSALLPAPTRLVEYAAQLGAAGGLGGYTFSLAEGTLPQGLVLEPRGAISGITESALGTTSNFVVRVTDGIGNVADRAFALTVVDGAPFTIATRTAPDGTVGEQYLLDLAAVNPTGAPVSLPVTWRLIGGALPPGLRLEASTREVAPLAGSPTRAGRFQFTVEAVDGQGRTDAVSYVMAVAGGVVTLSAEVPALVPRGAAVDVTFSASPAHPDFAWWLRDGQLPPGLALEGGRLVGTVSADAPEQTYTFTVGYGVARDQLAALGHWSVRVGSEAPRRASGCATTGLTGPAWLLAAVLVRRRRRSTS